MYDNHVEVLLKGKKKRRNPDLLNIQTEVILGKTTCRICFKILRKKKKHPEIRLAMSWSLWTLNEKYKESIIIPFCICEFYFLLFFFTIYFSDMWNLPLENQSVKCGSLSQRNTYMHQLSPPISRREPMESGLQSSGLPDTYFPAGTGENWKMIQRQSNDRTFFSPVPRVWEAQVSLAQALRSLGSDIGV